MSTPHDPDEEAPRDDVSAEDAAWRSIVDDCGDRPEIEDPEVAAPTQSPVHHDEVEPPSPVEPDDRYRPPPPPPLPCPAPLGCSPGWACSACQTLRARAARGEIVPTWMGLVLMVWFVGGFVYLVASMRPGSGDDYDDGAVL